MSSYTRGFGRDEIDLLNTLKGRYLFSKENGNYVASLADCPDEELIRENDFEYFLGLLLKAEGVPYQRFLDA